MKNCFWWWTTFASNRTNLAKNPIGNFYDFTTAKKTLKVNKPFKICFIISLSKYYTARKFKMKVYEEQRMNSRQVQFHDQKLRVHVKFIRLCLPLKQLNLRNSFLHQRLFFLKISYTKIMIFKIIKLEISSKGFFT